MKFECDVKGCNFKTANRLEALAHVRIHVEQKNLNQGLYKKELDRQDAEARIMKVYESYKILDVDKEAGK